MRIHDLGPRAEDFHPAAKHSPWEEDYGTRGFPERERPYIDERPLHQPGWEASSVWGTRPVRQPERDLERGGAIARRFIQFGWTRIRNAVRGTRTL
jgi:hypothetical protein